MKLSFKSILTSISVVLLFSFFVFALSPVSVYASIDTGICSGANLDATNIDSCNTVDTTANATSSVNKIIKTVINILSFVVGVVSVIMIIIGGLKYVTSGGDSNSISSAKNTILYALVGLVIVALAQVIVMFVLNRVKQPDGPPKTKKSYLIINNS